MRALVILCAVMFAASLGASAAHADGHSTEIVQGKSQGNHRLDCLVIRPWGESGPGEAAEPFPLIGWTNGWDQGNVLGATTTDGYTPGLIAWALDGPYLVIAARQWSAREADLVQCLEWLIEQNEVTGSEYEGLVDASRLGIAGHSQGGGATLKTGAGTKNVLTFSGIVAMNPYGPNWPSVGPMSAPLFLLGGAFDTTTPPASYDAIWFDVLAGDVGGINAVASDGTHNSDAWGVDPITGETLPTEQAALVNFVRYQSLTEDFWRFVLKDDAGAGILLHAALMLAPWDVEIHEPAGFVLNP